MPSGFPAFPSSSGAPRLPEDPNDPYWEQQAKNANPPPHQYRDDPMSSGSREEQNLIDSKEGQKEQGTEGEKEKKKDGEKGSWQSWADYLSGR